MNAAGLPRVILLLTWSLTVAGCAAAGAGEGGGAGVRVAGGYHGTFARAVVAADHAMASAAGAEMLAKGGNAVDAAVATSFALSVVRPYSCGIGGGGFMVIKFHDDPKHGNLATALNYRETTPAAMGPDFFESIDDAEASTRGGKASGVPGTVAGLLYALERYGTLDRATVLAPAIRAAEAGFVVDAHYVDSTRDLVAWYRADPARQRRLPFVWQRFLKEGRVRAGDRIRLPEQAEALRLIARDGAGAFYRGPIAEAMASALAADGGVMTLADLADYTPREAAPLRFDAMGRTALTMPPPSSGGVALAQIFLLYARLTADLGARVEDAAGRLHLLVECMKHAFADRARFLADPEYVPVPVDWLLSPVHAADLAGRFDPARALPGEAYGAAAPPPDDGGTSHFSVVDARGNAVACTETINLVFGSCLAVERYGFVMNNQIDDFTTRRGRANAFNLIQSDRNLPAPGKRPLSSMTPTIVLDDAGRPLLVVGASGGPRIITGVLQVMLRVLSGENASAADAVAAPRVHHQWQPDVLHVERGALRPGEAAGLARRGHFLKPTDSVGNVQLIRRARGGEGWEAASDPRKGGRPAGL